MIVTITSLGPKRALSTPGTAPTASAAERRGEHAHRARRAPPGVRRSASPPARPRSPPAASWLSPPMLNMPARRRDANASPVKVSVVAL
jgi:hypothetical protein